MGVETAGAKGKGPTPVGTKTGAATSSKNPPANPPVKQFANQLQQDIEDVTVEVNIYIYSCRLDCLAINLAMVGVDRGRQLSLSPS